MRKRVPVFGTSEVDFVRVQLVRGTGISSKAIAWFGGAGKLGFSHLDSVLPDAYCREHGLPLGSLLGARSDSVGGQDPGVRIRPPDYEEWDRRVVFEIKATAAQQKAWLDFHIEQLGKPYDKSLILGIAFGNAWGTPRDWRNVDSWICSEEGMRALEISKIIRPLYLPASKISPNSAALAISAGGGIVQYERPAPRV